MPVNTENYDEALKVKKKINSFYHVGEFSKFALRPFILIALSHLILIVVIFLKIMSAVLGIYCFLNSRKYFPFPH